MSQIILLPVIWDNKNNDHTSSGSDVSLCSILQAAEEFKA
jgi:hypothetical protein